MYMSVRPVSGAHQGVIRKKNYTVDDFIVKIFGFIVMFHKHFNFIWQNESLSNPYIRVLPHNNYTGDHAPLAKLAKCDLFAKSHFLHFHNFIEHILVTQFVNIK